MRFGHLNAYDASTALLKNVIDVDTKAAANNKAKHGDRESRRISVTIRRNHLPTRSMVQFSASTLALYAPASLALTVERCSQEALERGIHGGGHHGRSGHSSASGHSSSSRKAMHRGECRSHAWTGERLRQRSTSHSEQVSDQQPQAPCSRKVTPQNSRRLPDATPPGVPGHLLQRPSSRNAGF